MRKLIVMIALAVLVTGCGDKKVDSSTDEKLKTSMEAVKRSLDDEKKKEFEDAVKAMVFSEIGNIFEASANPDGTQRTIKDKLHGKTANEIIAEGNRIIVERKKKEREQALSEIEETKTKVAELEKKRSDADKAKEDLKKFNVVRSRFYFRKISFMEEAVIELTVKNETQHAVSRAYFHGVLSSPGRSVPWVKDSFNYTISGGLEPREQVTWKLSPNMYGEWGNAPKGRNDMILTVAVTRIDGADEKPIYDSKFSEWDKENLEKLNERLNKLEKTVQN